MSSELNVREELSDDFVRIFINGEIDIYTAREFKEKLYNIVDSNQKDLKIDCRELNYIDSTGLGILVGALKKTKQNGNDIFVENLKDNIKKLFLITGLDKLFIIK
jgi:anti-sigma B factor antagonist